MTRTPRLLPVVRLRVIMALFAVLAAIGGLSYTRSVFADSPAPPMPVIVNSAAIVAHTGGYPIRIRSGPGTNYTTLAETHEGQTVNVLDGPTADARGWKWFKVQAPVATGWMAGQYLQGTGIPILGNALITNTGADPLRVRDAPNTGGNILLLVNPGTLITVNAGPVTDNAAIAWYNVTAQGITGWSMAQYLTPETASTAQPVTPASPPLPPPPPPAPPLAPTPTRPPVAAPAPPQTSGLSRFDQYRLWMEQARAQYPYGESVSKMWSVMMCESSGNPQAIGGGYYKGLFQYAPGTWAGYWNPYRGNSVWDARSQIFATAKAWSIGMQHAWQCY